MDIAAAHSHLSEILIQLLCHSLSESSHKHALIQFFSLADLLQKVIHLVLGRTNLDRRIKKTGRTHNLLNHKAFRLLKLVICRGRAHEHLLACDGLELIKLERSVISCSRQTETIVHKH